MAMLNNQRVTGSWHIIYRCQSGNHQPTKQPWTGHDTYHGSPAIFFLPQLFKPQAENKADTLQNAETLPQEKKTWSSITKMKLQV